MTTDQIFQAATHEAAHAVMRWLRGLPAGYLEVNDDGTGCCNGYGRRVSGEDGLLITLAGYAVANFDYVLFGCTEGLHEDDAADLVEAREILEAHAPTYLCAPVSGPGRPSVEDALEIHLERVGNMLSPYSLLIDHIAGRLVSERHLSARSVAAICREWEKAVRCDEQLLVRERIEL